MIPILVDGMIPIHVDCDQVLSHFIPECLKLAAKNYNVFARFEDCTQREVWESIGCPYLPRDIDEEVIHREFCYRMEPISEGLEMLRELEARYGKDNVHILTKPWDSDGRGRATGQWAEQRFNWLRDHCGIGRDRIGMISNKHFVSGLLIDDSVKHIEGRKYGFCIAQPYNTSYDGPRGTHAEALEYVDSVVRMIESLGAL